MNADMRFPSLLCVGTWLSEKFLRGELVYSRIYDAAAGAVEAIGWEKADSLETILASDEAARAYVRENF